MYRVVAVSGSLREASSNLGLVRMAARVAPADLGIEIYDGLDDLPYYNGDLDAPGQYPEAVQRWRDAVGAADGVILGAPEYNHGPTALMKNAVDWLSRPWGKQVWQGKVVTIVSSGESGGGRRVQAYLDGVLGALGNTMVTEPPIAVEHGAKVISVDGTTTVPEIEAAMVERMANFAEALRQRA